MFCYVRRDDVVRPLRDTPGRAAPAALEPITGGRGNLLARGGRPEPVTAGCGRGAGAVSTAKRAGPGSSHAASADRPELNAR
ncbi:hypothetical protein Afe04nite_69030 [Asanoa ferruginea]|nr:hypothetical protein Afe04nite_69030 [Asanoa ferruginea]